jgi:hypothetical protein
MPRVGVHVADNQTRILWATWHSSHVYLLYTWQIVQFATTRSITPRTRVWPPYTWRPISGKMKFFFCSACTFSLNFHVYIEIF